MRAVLALVACLTVPSLALAAADETCAGKTGEVGHFTRTLVSSGMARTYLLDVPEGYAPTRGTPLVFNFHGLGSNAQSHADYTGMVAAAAEHGVIVVHPEGYESSWNAGACCGQAAAEDVDDVQFVRDMVADLSRDYCIDPDRIHSTGFSNGGYMSHRLACEASDLVASVAPVSGLVGVECAPPRGVAVHDTQGTADPLVWYGPASTDMEEWAARNACRVGPTVYYDKGNVTCERWTECDDDVDVEYCALRGVGHRWVESRWIDTTDENLLFFESHPMP